MTAVAVYVVLIAALYCGWVCGRSHERHNHHVGSVTGFRGNRGH